MRRENAVRPRRAPALLSCGFLLAASSPALAQSSVWDATISNTYWYVTVPQMLAYAAPSTSFANPIPIGDQTLWTLGTSVNGVFSGSSSAQLAIGPITTSSDSLIQGSVTPAGQITMVFTPTTGGATTIGLGQMTDRGGVTQMEMQMITGTSLLVTHWAYMVPYDPAVFTPPAAQVVPSNASPQWAWAAGTPWHIVSPHLFDSPSAGTLVITNYKSGYFWGTGVGPGGATFTVLGSITPEGKVLLNAISPEGLSSLYGDVTGDPSTAAMLLGAYNSLGNYTGDVTYLSLIAPYADAVTAANNPSALGAANVLYEVAGTTDGLFGPLAPAIGVLNDLGGAALSTAISQTLPILAGAGAQATYATQRALQQVVMTRLDAIHGADAPGTERNVWLRPFGAFADQGSLDGVPGYSTSGGGVAAGIDRVLSPDFVLGGVFAYSYTSITGSNDAVPNSLDISTYQLGVYGAYSLAPDLDLSFQLDAGLNRNSESRSIAFMGSTASADYDGYTTHAGLGLRKTFAVAPGITLAPTLRLDYAQVGADAYSETGAGALDLSVSSQTYRELMLSAGLKGAYQIADHVLVTANAGIGYNTLNNQTQITASYAGGGGSFVTTGLDVSPWLFTAGVGLVGMRTERLDLSLNYDLEASPSGFLNQMGSLVLKMRI